MTKDLTSCLPTDTVNQAAQSMKAHDIDYMPGCADLGDFDPTSTTIALDPVEMKSHLPQEILRETFERYWTFFENRRIGREPWLAYTPYEMRTIGAFTRLGWRDRADSLSQYFLADQRPPGWHQWPEVVWKDARAPHRSDCCGNIDCACHERGDHQSDDRR